MAIDGTQLTRLGVGGPSIAYAPFDPKEPYVVRFFDRTIGILARDSKIAITKQDRNVSIIENFKRKIGVIE